MMQSLRNRLQKLYTHDLMRQARACILPFQFRKRRSKFQPMHLFALYEATYEMNCLYLAIMLSRFRSDFIENVLVFQSAFNNLRFDCTVARVSSAW